MCRTQDIEDSLIIAARQVQRQYGGLDLDLADGVNVALAAGRLVPHVFGAHAGSP